MDKTALMEIAKRANGMLTAEAYHAMFECAADLKPSNALEVGTAHGASAIVACLGALRGGASPKIVTIDKMGGESSRTRYGSPEDNRKIVLGNFAAAGVSDHIELYVGTSEEYYRERQPTDTIDLLILDADGRIDRDLIFFGNRLREGAIIVIDDVNRIVDFFFLETGETFIGLKHEISANLLAVLVEQDIVTIERVVDKTAFCRLVRPYDFDTIAFRDLALAAYREVNPRFSTRSLPRKLFRKRNRADFMRQLFTRRLFWPRIRS